MKDEYDPAKDAHDSYYAAVAAKKARGDALLCPCCGKLNIPGFSKAETHIVSHLARAKVPLSGEELLAGSGTSIASFDAFLFRIRAKLKPIGLEVKTSGGKKRAARYRLQPAGNA